jgi:putative intracellular protease/amidase
LETAWHWCEKGKRTLTERGTNHKGCVLVVIADGFDEKEIVAFLSLLRQEGLCVKSVGLTSGLTGGTHGVWLKPDLTFTDVEGFMDATPISVVILPEGGQNLARMENDPRVHRLLRRVVAQRGRIATGPEGLRIVRAAEVWCNGHREAVLVRQPDQLPGAFTRYLIARLK